MATPFSGVGVGSAVLLQNPQTWGRLHQASGAFLSSSSPCLSTRIQELMDVWSHFDERQQDDVGDFVGHLWSTASPQSIGGKIFHVRFNGVLEEREQVPLYLLCPPGESRISLGELINLWAMRRLDSGAPTCLILHVQRFQLLDQQWTKHHRALEVPTTVVLPYSNDGVNISSLEEIGKAMVIQSKFKAHVFASEGPQLFREATSTTSWSPASSMGRLNWKLLVAVLPLLQTRHG